MLFLKNHKKLVLALLMCCALVPSSSSAYFWQSWSKKQKTAAVITASAIGLGALGYYVYTLISNYNNNKAQNPDNNSQSAAQPVENLIDFAVPKGTATHNETDADTGDEFIDNLFFKVHPSYNLNLSDKNLIQYANDETKKQIKNAKNKNGHTLLEAALILKNHDAASYFNTTLGMTTTREFIDTYKIVLDDNQIPYLQESDQEGYRQELQEKNQQQLENNRKQEESYQQLAAIEQHKQEQQKINQFRTYRPQMILKLTTFQEYQQIITFIKNAPEQVLTEICNDTKSFIDIVFGTYDTTQYCKAQIIQALFDKITDTQILFEKMMLEPHCAYVAHNKHTACALTEEKIDTMMLQAFAILPEDALKRPKQSNAIFTGDKKSILKNLHTKLQALNNTPENIERLITTINNGTYGALKKDQALLLKWSYKQLLHSKNYAKDLRSWLEASFCLCMQHEQYTIAAWLLNKMFPVDHKITIPKENKNPTQQQQEELQRRTARVEYFNKVWCDYNKKLIALKNENNNHPLFSVLNDPYKNKKIAFYL